jgi:Flp pilus assembly protein CpaB
MSAGLLFAIAMAIIIGLLFAWLFKMVLLDKKPAPKPVDDTEEITVAAANIYDQTEVKSVHVKKVRVDKKRYAELSKTDRGPMLKGNQPVGRVTKIGHWIKAEEPFYEEDLYPYTYPDSIKRKLEPGYRAAIVTVAAKEAMVQVDDYVDVYCTLSNDALGPGGQGTAEIAKGAKVIARFGTTRPGAQPARLDAPREYTLQVTPYRFALMELAKTMGAKFSLTVAPQPAEGDSKSLPASNDVNDPKEQVADRVSGADLATLFGIAATPGAPGPWEIEKYVGIKNEGKTSYPGYVPPSRAGGSTTPPAPPPAPGGDSQVRPPPKVAPVGYTPPAPAGRLPTPAPTRATSFTPSATVASSSRSFGFRAPTDRTYKPYDPSCPT